ncbi:hypothetical protein NDU88_001563 [Pleurodeles waltl]|uniref:Uncharacterized protein n=1 Tax=Pleurodeles waltl TaxID=8319 RepID=A0AAV7SZK9_PLEWA|nr:hypothetical protein NDU88_001563 [Pleurodeles waltl]
MTRDWMGRFCVPWYKVEGVTEKRRVAQQKYVQRDSLVHNRRRFDWKVGDSVRVKSPRFSGLSKFSSGKTIVQVGDSAVKLDDGKRWNKDKISLTKSVAMEKVKDGGSGEFVVRQESQLPFTSSAVKYPKRVVGPPKKFDDYVVRSSHRPTKGGDVLCMAPSIVPRSSFRGTDVKILRM